MKVSIIGAGYVGLVTGACLARMGNDVLLVESDCGRAEAVRCSKASFYEEGLDELLASVELEADEDCRRIRDSQLIFICVGTPCNHDGEMVLEQVAAAARDISEVLRQRDDYCVVVVKSTVPPGTTEETVIPVLEHSGRKAGRDFGVCMAPEFLREGKAVYDFMNPMRLVIGEYDTRSGNTLLELFRDFKTPVVRSNLRTAEMIKLAANVFLATKISYINEIGNICKKLNIDTYEVARGLAYDDRIGGQFLNAGLGFGGSCLPKDLRALIASARQYGYQPHILEEVQRLNKSQALKPLELLARHIRLNGATVGLLGLAFKPETDDIRDSRAIAITAALLNEGAAVKAYDPMAVENFKKLFPQVAYTTAGDVLESDAVIIVTEWPEFNNLDYGGRIVIDGRRVEKARVARIYEGVCW